MAELYYPEVIRLVYESYPEIGALLGKPGVFDVMYQVINAEVNGTPWSDAQITAALQATQYYKTTNQTAREFDILTATDPATTEQTAQVRKMEILAFARQAGLNVTEQEAIFMAWTSLQKGETEQQWKAGVLSNPAFLTDQMPATDRLQAMAADYAVPLSDRTAIKWARDILSGQVNEETFRAYLVEQAKSLFPGLSNALDRGITVSQYVAPYAEIAVQELGINGADIDWRDQKWMRAIHQIDPKTGQPTAMSISDWLKEIRTNPVYGFDQTQRAQEQATQLSQALLERFGRAA